MSSLSEDLPQRSAMSRVWRGLVMKDAADIQTRIDVTIPKMNVPGEPVLRFEDVRWQSRDATSLPTRGDECLIIFDEDREPWVVAWWPF